MRIKEKIAELQDSCGHELWNALPECGAVNPAYECDECGAITRLTFPPGNVRWPNGSISNPLEQYKEMKNKEEAENCLRFDCRCDIEDPDPPHERIMICETTLVKNIARALKEARDE